MNDQEIIIKTLEKENELLKSNLREKEKKNASINEYKKIIESLEKENKSLREQIEAVVHSRSYKFLQKILQLFKR